MKGGVPCLGAMFARKGKAKVILPTHDDERLRSNVVELEELSQRFPPVNDSVKSVRGGDVRLSVPKDAETGSAQVSKPHNIGNVFVDVGVPERRVAISRFENERTEANYEGEDEDEDANDQARPLETRDCDSDHPLSDGASEYTLNREYPPHTDVLGKDSARYYETPVNGTYGSNMMERENSFTDVEMASGHLSDPGVYHTKESESLCSSPSLPHGCKSEEKHTNEVQLLQQSSLGAPSECESARHPDSLSAMCGHQILMPSYESSSTGGEVRDLASGACVPTGQGSRSEAAYQLHARDSMFNLGSSTEALDAQARKPWWKVFLVSHRNIHRESSGVLGFLSEGDAGRIPTINGYVSDVEARTGHVSPSVLNDAISDSEKDQDNGQGLEKGSLGNYSLNSKSIEISGDKSVKEEGEINLWRGEESIGNFNSTNTTQKWDSFTEKVGLSQVEQWLSTIHYVSPSLDDENQLGQVDPGPESPVAPAASFFHSFNEEIEWKESEDSKQVPGGPTQVDGAVDADVEMARMVVRSVNPLSTVAHFSGVGLKIVPSLGAFGNLKTLNLSANHFVRIPPGCLPKSLHSLDISRNQIVLIEGLRELTRLRVLNLSMNRVSRIGNGLSSCTSLKELYLTGNKISEVEGLHRLSKLVVLDLSFNKLATTKSLGQIAANYKSLQALNLLGNAVQSNLGDEQMRRFVTGVCPQLSYLNRQPLKSVSTREAVVDNVARAAMGKELKGGGKGTTKPSKRSSSHASVASHRRSSSGGGSGNVKAKPGGKGAVSPVLLPQGEGHHRKHKTAVMKDLPKGFVPLPPTAASRVQPRVRVSRSESVVMPRVKSDGVLFHENSGWRPTTITSGTVQAH